MLVDPFGSYEELPGVKKNGFKKVNFADKSMDVKKDMFRLFLEGDATPNENKLFLY
ncbi:hypothetical protein [Listeria cossartiae]|uniref:hypothetical protein n=1 Tax=Listeria cossartiae TaxID=2838249 RepID=UPI0021AB1A03|nr:hypothetical protein [Listeria cossartiae]